MSQKCWNSEKAIACFDVLNSNELYLEFYFLYEKFLL
jgi:hypothetical protein